MFNVPYGIPRNAVYGSMAMNPYSATGGAAGAEMGDNVAASSQPSTLPALSLVGIILVLVMIRVMYELAD